MSSYSMKELAGLYFPASSPRAATTQLRRWINRNNDLTDALAQTGLTKGQRLLTPRRSSWSIWGNPDTHDTIN